MDYKEATTAAAQETSAAHTPGPWKVWHSIRDGSVNVVNAAGEFVCEVGVPDGNPKDYEIRADACLIAAAPDLLAALKALLGQANNIEVLGEWEALDMNYSTRRKARAEVDKVKDQARAAIAKAKGEA